MSFASELPALMAAKCCAGCCVPPIRNTEMMPLHFYGESEENMLVNENDETTPRRLLFQSDNRFITIGRFCMAGVRCSLF